MRLDTAIEGCSSTQTVVLLAHQPKAAKDAIMSGHKIDLILSGRFSCTLLIHFGFHNVTICISGVMVSILTLSAVDCGFEPQSGQIKNYRMVFVVSPLRMQQ